MFLPGAGGNNQKSGFAIQAKIDISLHNGL